MSVTRDIIFGAGDRYSHLLARGLRPGDVDELIAFRVFMARACTPDLDPTAADHDYQRGAIGGRAYLRLVAPEELTL